MFNINKVNLNNNYNDLFKTSPVIPSLSARNKSSWCDIINVDSKRGYSKSYQDIFKTHAVDNKWILVVNPESELLEQLHSEGKINPKKILKVNTNKVNVKIEHIKNALLKGNCSALILSNAYFSECELAQLSLWADEGKTQCVILKQTQQLH